MKSFFLACRPKTLIASLSPICIGTSFAIREHSFQLWVFLFTVLTGLGIQITTNIANDLFDFLKGADTPNRKGPLRVTASGLMTISQVKWTTVLVMCLTVLFGSVLSLRGGWVIASMIPLALLLAIGYTAGPFPLAYLGVAEIFVLIFFGPVATLGTYYLQTLAFSKAVCIAGIAPGLLSCSILVINNLRDKEEDKQANKRTLIVRFGTQFGKWEYCLAVVIACLIPLSLYKEHPLVLLTTLILLPALFLIRAAFHITDPFSYGPIFEKTGKLLALYTFYFSCSLLL